MQVDSPRLRVLLVVAKLESQVSLQECLCREPDIEVLGSFGNAQNAFPFIRTSAPQLIFLEVDALGPKGFSVLEKLRGGPAPLIVFVASSKEHAFRAFEFSALDYLLQPLNPDRIKLAITKARSFLQLQSPPAEIAAPMPHRIAIRCKKNVTFFSYDEIHFIEAEGNFVRIHSSHEPRTLEAPISYIEKLLDPVKFFRIHRSTIVNIDQVKRIEIIGRGKYRVVLHNGMTLSMSRKNILQSLTGNTISESGKGARDIAEST